MAVYEQSPNSEVGKLAAAAVSHLTKIATGRPNIVDDVTFELPEGEFTLLKGDNGAGKSTLMRMMVGIEPPDKGNVMIAGVSFNDITSNQQRELLGRKVGIVFQTPNLYRNRSVIDNIMDARNGAAGLDEAYMVKLIKRLNLGPRLYDRAANLSGGEQQKVSLVRALANRPKLLLADEPTNMCDPATGLEIFKFFRELSEEQQATILMISHDERATEFTDRTLVMQAGRLSIQRIPNSEM